MWAYFLQVLLLLQMGLLAVELASGTAVGQFKADLHEICLTFSLCEKMSNRAPLCTSVRRA